MALISQNAGWISHGGPRCRLPNLRGQDHGQLWGLQAIAEERDHLKVPDRDPGKQEQWPTVVPLGTVAMNLADL